MSEQRKKHSVAYWTMVWLAVLVSYLASSGPFVWLNTKGYLPNWAGIIYYPFHLASKTSHQIERLLDDWARLWLP